MWLKEIWDLGVVLEYLEYNYGQIWDICYTNDSNSGEILIHEMEIISPNTTI